MCGLPVPVHTSAVTSKHGCIDSEWMFGLYEKEGLLLHRWLGHLGPCIGLLQGNPSTGIS